MQKIGVALLAFPLIATVQPTQKFVLYSAAPGVGEKLEKFHSLELCELAQAAFMNLHRADNERAFAEWRKAREKNPKATVKFAGAVCVTDNQT